MRTSFTSEELECLQERVLAYLNRINKVVQGSSVKYAQEQAKLFCEKWKILRDGLKRDDIEIQTEKWEALTEVEQVYWSNLAKQNCEQEGKTVADSNLMEQNHKNLPHSLATVLSSYSRQTEYSFLLLCAGPNETDGVVQLNTYIIDHSPLENVPSFQEFHKDYVNAVKQPWIVYGQPLEETQQERSVIQKILNFNADGYPKLSELHPDWTVAHIQSIPSDYLNQLWFMTRSKEAKHRVVLWTQVQKSPTLYYSPEQLPPQPLALVDPGEMNVTLLFTLYEHLLTRQENFSPSFTFLLELPAMLTSPTKKVDPITHKKDAITLLSIDVISEDEEEPDEGDCVGEPAVSIIRNGGASSTFKQLNQPELPQGKHKTMASDMDTVQRDMPQPRRGRPIGSGCGGNTRGSRGDRGGNKEANNE
ncbi:hypothetical protein M422DRAFT_264336 [Sphaerobolus stellatus SS14]|uniref:Unplaced genomic scaffold SPHSTscaffold_134, whole genome shotgun sequence n=1 Tax=Sphaerobolus stellatus (strain SS14) TaxID=990650 RepID=A0A0C9TTN4_SPHS4|nr:hypothetical protein M422DRAFT_264336 [Sphaerobolus stellatus SS14]